MRRHPALVPLSRDHHVALSVALRLRQSEIATADEARRALLAFWRKGGAAHFQAEEAILLPAIEGHPLQREVIAQHDEIRERIAAIETSVHPEPAVLHDLGTRLADHVRLEERELFPLLERTLDEASLVRVAEATEAYS